jgi:hypothetical protein
MGFSREMQAAGGLYFLVVEIAGRLALEAAFSLKAYLVARLFIDTISPVCLKEPRNPPSAVGPGSGSRTQESL